MPKRALIVWGGWEGHEPEATATIAAEALRGQGYEVEVTNDQDRWLDADELQTFDLLVPNVSHGTISREQEQGLLTAVKAGVGFGGWHGGMGDSFRASTNYQYAVGGQWVAHPGNIITYTVNVTNQDDPITAGVPDFQMTSEQYYMHTDPSNEVLAWTTFTDEHDDWIGGTRMPVVWKRRYGKGKVFYSSCGHVASDLRVPEALTILTRGLLWATR
jgi:type 1 glutamine amidotransferase